MDGSGSAAGWIHEEFYILDYHTQKMFIGMCGINMSLIQWCAANGLLYCDEVTLPSWCPTKIPYPIP